MIRNLAQVEILPAAALPERFKFGKVVGVMTTEFAVLGCIHAVDVGEEVSEVYPYQVVGIAEIHLKEKHD